MHLIFMLTRNDRTVEDADCLVDEVCSLGVTHVGFKDIGVPPEVMRVLVERIRQHRGVCYLEVVSTTADAVARSLECAAALTVAVSAVMLALIDQLERRSGRQPARVLADAALMTPAITLWLYR